MASKLVFAQRCQEVATALGQRKELIDDLVKAYFDRTYNSGGADAITDADVSSLGITAANVGSFITLCQQLQNFFGNAGVTQADYAATLSRVRTDV